MDASHSSLDQLSEAFADAVEKVTPSVVSVVGRRRLPGTGTIWQTSDASFVVTASHVVEREESIEIVAGEHDHLTASLVSRDFGCDLAVLRVDGLQAEPIVQRERPARVGNLVMAVGRPFVTPSATIGSITSIGAIRFRRFQTPTLIHAETTPLPGFSGGPLVDPTGAAVGINTSGLMRRGRPLGGNTGIVTIPAQQVDYIVADIVEFGRVRYGWIGVAVQAVDLPASARDNVHDQDTGLLITGVTPDSPAMTAGLVVGDILVAMGDQPLTDIADLQQLLSGRQIGSAIALQVLRGGSPVSVELTPVERPERGH